MVNEHEILEIIRAIHQGECSRNSNFERLSSGAGRRAHIAYNRLTSLLAEISGEGARVSFTSIGKGVHALAVCVERMGYTHRARLSRWEAAFFLDDLGGRELLPAGEGNL
ncbi:MAG: hypothetical protein C0608_05630 [Deltaproteobacteria bacterium]|nr:MAG: hypothetical protein C0608_05630 [Deltaproteobacteria bacterium]